MRNVWHTSEVLEAYDLTGTYRGAAALVGCDHHTVRRHVRMREEGVDPSAGTRRRAGIADAFTPKIEELVELTRGRISAESVHRRLVRMGFDGSVRTTRRAVAVAKAAYRQGQRRERRGWLPEPGLWLQWAWSPGPDVAGERSTVWHAWLAWSRYRIAYPVPKPDHAALAECLGRAVRFLGGAPCYCVTLDEAALAAEGTARLAARYRTHLRLCESAAEGPSGPGIPLEPADLLPPLTELPGQVASSVELRDACRHAVAAANARLRTETGRSPERMLLDERQALRTLPVAGGRGTDLSDDGES